MQEAPPSPATRPSRKHQLRFHASILVMLLTVTTLIWGTAKLIIAEYWFLSFFPAYVAAMIIFISPRFLRGMNSRARIEALICEFDQISDRFVRPKAYRHKALTRHSAGTIVLKSFIYGLCLDSEGNIGMPEMTDTPEHTYKNDQGLRITNDYGVSICINDDIVHIRKKEDAYTNNKLWLVRFFEEYSRKGPKIAHLRIHKHDIRSDVVAGDFTIEGEEFDAFMKTLELLKHFNVTPGFQP